MESIINGADDSTATSPDRRSALTYRRFGDPAGVLQIDKRPLQDRGRHMLGVAMVLAPINPSDLIPITGAYPHRIALPAIGGYEGVGQVVDASPDHADWIGRRVLPLRGEGTWQSIVDCDADLAIRVPDYVPDHLAARAYINPLAALCMMDARDVAGRTVLLLGAGSNCADYLGALAREHGAKHVIGIYRSLERAPRLEALGIEPVGLSDARAVTRATERADITFDALGGPVGTEVLKSMRAATVFVSYGLLSGEPIAFAGSCARHCRFHLRDALAGMSVGAWQGMFGRVWPLLRHVEVPAGQVFAARQWRQALIAFARPGRAKPLLDLQAF